MQLAWQITSSLYLLYYLPSDGPAYMTSIVDKVGAGAVNPIFISLVFGDVLHWSDCALIKEQPP